MSIYKPCPKCSATGAERVIFSPWGGIVGPLILTHVRCQQGRTAYNGKTGRSNTTGIIIYATVACLIFLSLIGLGVYGVLYFFVLK